MLAEAAPEVLAFTASVAMPTITMTCWLSQKLARLTNPIQSHPTPA